MALDAPLPVEFTAFLEVPNRPQIESWLDLHFSETDPACLLTCKETEKLCLQFLVDDDEAIDRDLTVKKHRQLHLSTRHLDRP